MDKQINQGSMSVRHYKVQTGYIEVMLYEIVYDYLGIYELCKIKTSASHFCVGLLAKRPKPFLMVHCQHCAYSAYYYQVPTIRPMLILWRQSFRKIWYKEQGNIYLTNRITHSHISIQKNSIQQNKWWEINISDFFFFF